jgi:hypothetical protein
VPPDRRQVTDVRRELSPSSPGYPGLARPVHDVELRARALREAAAALRTAAELPGSSRATGAVMDEARQALRIVSATCYELAADAAPDVAPRPYPLDLREPRRPTPSAPSREWQMALTTALHEVATETARAARLCGEAARRTTRLLGRRAAPESLSREAS